MDAHPDIELEPTHNTLRTFRSRTTRIWCPSQSAFIEQRFPNLRITFENLEPLKAALDHSECRERLQCQAVSSAAIPSAHVCADQNCPDAVIAPEDLMPILRSGRIPVLYFAKNRRRGDEEGDHDSKECLRIRAMRPTDVYVAISHVWSDGLGNPVQNALPSCRIHQLGQYVAAVLSTHKRFRLRPRGAYFWLDTLCIPLASNPEYERLKLEQIAKMTLIYSKAFATLVLDSGLTKIQNADAIWSNALLAQIMTCGWATRSWCFQEGALSERCAYKFANKILILQRQDLDVGKRLHVDSHSVLKLVDLRQWFDPDVELRQITWIAIDADAVNHSIRAKNTFKTIEFPTKGAEIVNPRLIQAFASQSLLVRPIWKTKWSTDRSYYSFIRIWNAMAGCYTSEETDITLILATVLDLKIEPLLTMTARERMRLICFSFDSLPLSLLFRFAQIGGDAKDDYDWWLPTGPGHDVLPLEARCLTLEPERNFAVLSRGTWDDVKRRDGSSDELDNDVHYWTLKVNDPTMSNDDFLISFDDGTGLKSYRIECLRKDIASYPPEIPKQSYVVFRKGQLEENGTNDVQGVHFYLLAADVRSAVIRSQAGSSYLEKFRCVPVSIRKSPGTCSSPNVEIEDLDKWHPVFRFHLLKPPPKRAQQLIRHSRSDLKVRRPFAGAFWTSIIWLITLGFLAVCGGIVYGLIRLAPSDHNVSFYISMIVGSLFAAIFGVIGLATLLYAVLLSMERTMSWIDQFRVRRLYRRRFD